MSTEKKVSRERALLAAAQEIVQADRARVATTTVRYTRALSELEIAIERYVPRQERPSERAMRETAHLRRPTNQRKLFVDLEGFRS